MIAYALRRRCRPQQLSHQQGSCLGYSHKRHPDRSGKICWYTVLIRFGACTCQPDMQCTCLRRGRKSQRCMCTRSKWCFLQSKLNWLGTASTSPHSLRSIQRCMDTCFVQCTPCTSRRCWPDRRCKCWHCWRRRIQVCTCHSLTRACTQECRPSTSRQILAMCPSSRMLPTGSRLPYILPQS